MIIVTGGAGFIGSNLVRTINQRSGDDVLVVDNLSNTAKVPNLADCTISDYRDKLDFYNSLLALEEIPGLDAVFHQGACSDTMVTDGRYVMHNNFEYSKALLNYCQHFGLPFIYASSASVYGGSEDFCEQPECEAPLNAYAWSKLVFDQHVRARNHTLSIPVVGLRYFNVYGPREQHKGRMASVAFHFYNQFKKDGKVRLFEGSNGYAHGQQLRDFVSVDDVVSVNLFFLDTPSVSGIFNLGTGACQSFNDVAVTVVNYCRSRTGEPRIRLEQMKSEGLVEYISFPDNLKGKYQSYTQANISALRQAGYDRQFLTVEQGVERYLDWMANRS